MSHTALAEALDRETAFLVSRLRGFSLARYAAAAPPFGANRDVVRHLTGELARLSAEAENVAARQLPDVPDHALADQLAVVAHDLWLALAAKRNDGLALSALGEVALHRRDVDGAPPRRGVVELLAEGLGSDATPGAVLLAATERCPRYARPAR